MIAGRTYLVTGGAHVTICGRTDQRSTYGAVIAPEWATRLRSRPERALLDEDAVIFRLIDIVVLLRA
jgi:hypothetical protein